MVLESQEISVAAEIENSDVVAEFILDILESIACTSMIKNQIITAVDELYGNIAKYAYADKPGMVTIRYTLEPKKRCIIIQLLDSGNPFNPLKHSEPDIKLGLKERSVGGLGIYIVKKSMDRFFYNYIRGKNMVTIVKKIA